MAFSTLLKEEEREYWRGIAKILNAELERERDAILAKLSEIPPTSHLGSKHTKLYTDAKDVYNRVRDSGQDLRDKWAKANLNNGVPTFRSFYL